MLETAAKTCAACQAPGRAAQHCPGQAGEVWLSLEALSTFSAESCSPVTGSVNGCGYAGTKRS